MQYFSILPGDAECSRLPVPPPIIQYRRVGIYASRGGLSSPSTLTVDESLSQAPCPVWFYIWPLIAMTRDLPVARKAFGTLLGMPGSSLSKMPVRNDACGSGRIGAEAHSHRQAAMRMCQPCSFDLTWRWRLEGPASAATQQADDQGQESRAND